MDERPSSAADYTVSIDWGDGSPLDDSATLTQDPSGYFIIDGSHTYATPGNRTIGISVTHGDGRSGSTSRSVSVIDSTLQLTVDSLSGFTGMQVSGTIGQLTDPMPSSTIADFTVTIDWGDGTSSPGTLSQTTPWSILGSHTYAQQGEYTIAASVQAVDGRNATASNTATISAASLVLQAHAISAYRGAPTMPDDVADFADTDVAYPAGNPSDYNATIDWGDGSLSPGQITVSGPVFPFLRFHIGAIHTYAASGQYTVTVTLITADGTRSAEDSAPANILVPQLSGTGVDTALLAFVQHTGIKVASFTDQMLATLASDYTVSIQWGDGSTSDGVVVATASGFDVRGDHQYPAAGQFNTRITITSADDRSITLTGTASVQLPPIAMLPVAVYGVAGKTLRITWRQSTTPTTRPPRRVIPP